MLIGFETMTLSLAGSASYVVTVGSVTGLARPDSVVVVTACMPELTTIGTSDVDGVVASMTTGVTLMWFFVLFAFSVTFFVCVEAAALAAAAAALAAIALADSSGYEQLSSTGKICRLLCLMPCIGFILLPPRYLSTATGVASVDWLADIVFAVDEVTFTGTADTKLPAADAAGDGCICRISDEMMLFVLLRSISTPSRILSMTSRASRAPPQPRMLPINDLLIVFTELLVFILLLVSMFVILSSK